MKRYHKYLSLLLALVMVFALIPAALAEDGEEEMPEVVITSAEDLERYGNDGTDQYLIIDQDLTLTKSITVTDNDYIAPNYYPLEEPTPDGEMRFYTLRVAEGCTLTVQNVAELAINSADDLEAAARVEVKSGSKELIFQGEIYLNYVLRLKDEETVSFCNGCRLTLGENGGILGKKIFYSSLLADHIPGSYKFGGYGYVLYGSEDGYETYAGYYGTEAALVEGLRNRPDGFPRVNFVILTTGLGDETGRGSVEITEQWPHVDEILIQDGTDLVVAEGGSLDTNYLNLLSDVVGWEENPASLLVEDGGSLTVRDYAEVQGDVCYGAGARVELGGGPNIFGAYPALCCRWLNDDGHGLYEPEDAAFETGGYRIVPGQEFYNIYYARTWENGDWVLTPLQPDEIQIEGGSLSLTPIRDLPDHAIREGEANGDCFALATCQDFYQTYTLSATVRGQTVTMQPDSYLGDVEFYSAPEFSTETFLCQFNTNPLKENVFYLGIRLPEDADYHVDAIQTTDEEGNLLPGQDRVEVEPIQDHTLYKITVKPEVVQDLREYGDYFNLTFHVQMRSNDGEGLWTYFTSIGVGTTSALGWKDGAPYYNENAEQGEDPTETIYETLKDDLTASLSLHVGETREGTFYEVWYNYAEEQWFCTPYRENEVRADGEQVLTGRKLDQDEKYLGLITTLTGRTPGETELYRLNFQWVEDPDHPDGGYWEPSDARADYIEALTVTVMPKAVHVERKEPTCTEPGNIEYWYQEQTGKYYSDEVCTVEITQAETVLPMLPHDYKYVNQKAPTFTEPGYSGDLVCANCGEVKEKGHVIPATGTVIGGIGGAVAGPSKPTAPMPFTDVSLGDWFYDDVKYVYENGLMNGTSDSKFSPYSTLTRAMVVTVLYRIEGEPATRYNGAFSDVANYEWYTDAVEWAAKNEIVTGYTTGKFGPNDSVTREQLAAILYRYAQLKGYDVAGSDSLSGCTDSATVSAYAVSAVKWAVDGDMLLTANGKLRPREAANRAEVAAAMASFYAAYVE